MIGGQTISEGVAVTLLSVVISRTSSGSDLVIGSTTIQVAHSIATSSTVLSPPGRVGTSAGSTSSSGGDAISTGAATSLGRNESGAKSIIRDHVLISGIFFSAITACILLG